MQAAFEAEYRRILDLRECLRVEEITVEMKADIERLYLDPPTYHAYQNRLGNVRVLLMRACQSLAYIEAVCAEHAIAFDPAAIDKRRAANRAPGHPFNMIAIYLKDDALQDFHNFEAFSDLDRLNAGDGPRGSGRKLPLPKDGSGSDEVESGSESESTSETSDDTSLDYIDPHNQPISTPVNKNQLAQQFESSHAFDIHPPLERDEQGVVIMST